MRALAALALALTICTAHAAEPAKKGPAWAELTVEQQQVLAPLKPEWDTLNGGRKLTWLGIAKRYPSMKPAEQERVVRRMQTWAKLTPEQRRAARERYRSIGKLSPEKRQDLRQQWAEYQALPPTEKRMFDVPPGVESRAKRKSRTNSKPQTAKPKTPPSLP